MNHRTPSRAVEVLSLVGATLLVALNLWLAAAVFEPVAASLGRVDYVFVSASFGRLAASVAAVGAILVGLRALAGRWPCVAAPDGCQVRALGWSALSLVPLLTLVSPLARGLPALNYVLHDLRGFWWLLILGVVLLRLRPAPATEVFAAEAAVGRTGDTDLRGHGTSQFARRIVRVFPTAALVAIPLVLVVAFTPHLRFSGTLHGDEPKYLRFCENFFQGFGFDVSRKQPLAERADDRPRVLDNLRLLLRAVPEELGLLLADAGRVAGASASPRLRSKEPSPSMFFEGKHPGTVYQLHNPGLSFLLFPGYYLDRRLTGSGVGYHGEFPAEMPALHATLLALYAAYGVALYALLTAWGASRPHAWLLAVLGTLMLPASAFAFQIYPEVPAGVVTFLVVRRLLTGAGAQRRLADFSHGVLASFLPWLHVRLIVVTLIAMLWTLADPRYVRRARLWFVMGVLAGLSALALYTYRLTGSLLPNATYGAGPPLSLSRVMHGLPAFAIDRVWGLFPHAPLYLLALPGLLLAWRRRPAAVWLVGLIITAVVVPAAGHGFWAGGSTPGRYLVAVAPLLLLFVAETVSAWSARRLFSATFITLAVVSLDTALRYGLHHVKERGPLVAKGFSGWRINLLFPSTGTEAWTTTSADIGLLAAWLAVAFLLIGLPLRLGAQPEAGAASVFPRIDLRAVAGCLLALACLGEVGARATGVGRAIEYLMPAREARERALARFAELPACVMCYSSAVGLAEPTVALGNDLASVDVQFRRGIPRAGDAVQLRVRPRSRSGEYIVTSVRVDFGDGSTASRPRAFADVEFGHRYEKAGDYAILVWVQSPSGEQLRERRTVSVLAP